MALWIIRIKRCAGCLLVRASSEEEARQLAVESATNGQIWGDKKLTSCKKFFAGSEATAEAEIVMEGRLVSKPFSLNPKLIKD